MASIYPPNSRSSMVLVTKSRSHFYMQIRAFLETICYVPQVGTPTSFRNFSSQQATLPSILQVVPTSPYEKRLSDRRTDVPHI
jgi:hypothetical protein